jgi:hypothetical protein
MLERSRGKHPAERGKGFHEGSVAGIEGVLEGSTELCRRVAAAMEEDDGVRVRGLWREGYGVLCRTQHFASTSSGVGRLVVINDTR